MPAFGSAFVTGSTGLLGNNLVRALVERGVRVTALARSRGKAEKQFAGLDVTIVEGDMTNVAGFAAALPEHDVLFHTAAHFRDSYKGGRHWDTLYKINVEGTETLLAAAHAAGIRRFVHTSSVAVLDGPAGSLIDETMQRLDADADDYYRSKILSDRAVLKFLRDHSDITGALVLPGWMTGPGDIGPTSSGQVILDFVSRKLPGRVPGTFSIVDARDVALAQIAAAERGRNGERYLAAGRSMSMDQLCDLLAQVSGVPAPKRHIPLAMLFAIASAYEAFSRATGRPVLLSLASVRLLARETGRSNYNPAKSERELGVTFRPVEETLRDTIVWYRLNGYLPPAATQDANPRLDLSNLRGAAR